LEEAKKSDDIPGGQLFSKTISRKIRQMGKNGGKREYEVNEGLTRKVIADPTMRKTYAKEESF